MPYTYIAGFNITSVVTGSEFALIVSSSGKTTFYISYVQSGANTYRLIDEDSNSSELYAHLDIGNTKLRDGTTAPFSSSYADDGLEGILQDALNTGGTTEGWGGTFTVSFSTTTGKYTISHSTVSFGLILTAVSKKVLGFNTSSLSAATSHTSESSCSYCVPTTYDYMSHVSDEYDMSSGSSLAISDGGYTVGMARTVAAVMMDWRQPFETKENTFMRRVVASEAWTFQHLFEHCRTVYPFIVCNTDMYALHWPVCLLTERGARFRPLREHPDYDGFWHIPFATYLYGWLSST